MCCCCCFIIITNIIIIIIVVIWASGLDATTDTNIATVGATTDTNTGTVGAGVVDGTSDVATASTGNDNGTNNKDPNWDTLDERVAIGIEKRKQKLKEQGNFFFVRVNAFVLLFYNLLFCLLFIYLFFMQSLREIKNWKIRVVVVIVLQVL